MNKLPPLKSTSNLDGQLITVHNSVPDMLLKAIDSYGFNGEQALNHAGITREQLSDEKTRVSVSQMEAFWRIAVALTKDNAIAVDFAKQLLLGAFYGLGFVWATSETLHQALNRLVRYFKIICTVGVVELEQTEDQVSLWLRLPVDAQDVFYPSVEGALTLFIQFCRLSYRSDFSPALVELQRPELVKSDKLARFFNCPIQYGAKENKIYFSKHSLSQSLPMANSQLASANDQVVNAYIESIESSSLSSMITSMILSQLKTDRPTLDSISNALCITPRTLQRKLKKESTSFNELFDAARCDLAINYLLHSNRSVSEIAYQLRFKDPANFSRCFNRWTGLSPSKYRNSCL